MKKVFQKRLLFSLVLSLLLIYFLNIIFIVAQERETIPTPRPEGGQTNIVTVREVFDPIRDLFANWEAGNLDINIAKYLFFILITIFIWSILDFSGVIPSPTATWVISIIVGFLSIAYVAPNQIWILLTSYDALGLTLIFLVPLIILGLFTLRIVTIGGATGILFQWAIWLIYLLFLIGTFVVGLVNGKISVSDPFAWIYIAAIVITAIVVFFNNLIIKFIAEEVIKTETERAESVLKKAVALRKMEASALNEQAGGRRR